MLVSIKLTDRHCRVLSPYNAIFAKSARKLAGSWEPPHWIFDRRDEERVRALCMEVYGCDGVRSDVCTMRVTYEAGERALAAPLMIHGRVVAKAWGRDSGAKLGEGIVLLEGSFWSGGSVKNWTTRAGDEGAVVLVRDFPRARAATLVATQPGEFAIEPEAPLIDRAGLEAERAAMVARMAEIDALLAPQPAVAEAAPEGA